VLIVEGANIVGEYYGAYANVLTYKRCCDKCGYLDPTNSTIVSMLSRDGSYEDVFYEAEGFSCPDCATYQAVSIRLERWEEAIYQEEGF
jgi:hypothetical protein